MTGQQGRGRIREFVPTRLGPAWRRVVARWIDIVAVGWLAALLVEVIDGDAGAALAIVVLVGFEIGCSLRWGRTPGKAMMGLGLAHRQGEQLAPWALALRPMVLFASFAVPWAYWIPVWATVLVAWMAVTSRGRVLHDLVVGSVVVRRR